MAVYGYIRACHPELKVREEEYYRAVYCGLCRTMGHCTGQCSRMTLSYDFAFFALVRKALTGEPVTIRRRACLRHPFHVHPMAEPDDTLSLCAFMSAILAYHKLQDDRRDETGKARLRASLMNPYMSYLHARSLRHGYGEVDRIVEHSIGELCRLEADCPASVDEPAERFGELLSRLLAFGLDGDAETLARVIGRHVGRWVYIVDAADDFAEDMKKGRYNPFICLYGANSGESPMTELPDEKKEEIRTALLGELLELEKAFDLLETDDPEHPDLGGVLSNILYMGMPTEAQRVLFGEKTPGKPSHRGRGKHRTEKSSSATGDRPEPPAPTDNASPESPLETDPDRTGT